MYLFFTFRKYIHKTNGFVKQNWQQKNPRFWGFTFLFGASDQIRTGECLVHSQVCQASSPHPPNA